MITQEEKAPGSSHSSFVGGTLDQHDGKDQQKTDDCAVTPTIDRLQCYNLLDLPAEILVEIFSHLPPSCFPRVHAVCRRFDFLISSSSLWRGAFLRHFPGPASLSSGSDKNHEEYQKALSRPRCFARLNPTTSWMKEYTIRTRMLRSLFRGRSSPELARHRNKLKNNNYASLTYLANVWGGISHIDGSFSSDAPPSFIHGCIDVSGEATTSDLGEDEATAYKIRFTSSNSLNPHRFREQHGPYFSPPPDITDGFIGKRTLMDVSHTYGFVFARRTTGDRAKLVSRENHSCIWLPIKGVAPADEKRGIPDLPNGCRPLVTAVWIAKSQAIPKMSKSSCGVFYGFANGFVAAYAVSSRFCSDAYFEPGDNTANWALSPGVPIIDIKADDCYSPERRSRRRVWAVALNALGELFYLKDIPAVKAGPRIQDMTLQDICAWNTGRTARWEMVEATRRRRKETQSSHRFLVDPEFCPRSYPDSVENMDQDMIIAETQWINNYMRIPPAEFDMTFCGLSMHKTLLVDFGGNDQTGAGESVVVINNYNTRSSIMRYTRLHAPRDREMEPRSYLVAPSTPSQKFNSSSHVPSSGDNWQVSTLVTLGEPEKVTASAIDTSPMASKAIFEDPILMNGRTDGSPEYDSIPGQRARFIALGDGSGTINIWGIRSQVVFRSDGRADTLQPIRVIQTSSSWITCLALNSLYLVHGGPDGLVQAWDPLGSGGGSSSSSSSSNPDCNPIRTIHSTFSPRMYHMLTYVYFDLDQEDTDIIPRALCLDPDPTKLRGLVSLGPWLRYWSFSNGNDILPASRRRDPQPDVKSGKRWVVPKPTYDLARFIQEEWEDVQLERERVGLEH